MRKLKTTSLLYDRLAQAAVIRSHLYLHHTTLKGSCTKKGLLLEPGKNISSPLTCLDITIEIYLTCNFYYKLFATKTYANHVNQIFIAY